nr:WAS/WASL-interacting protein family member 1-like [Aegilops tauschii subsp. strangulata]
MARSHLSLALPLVLPPSPPVLDTLAVSSIPLLPPRSSHRRTRLPPALSSTIVVGAHAKAAPRLDPSSPATGLLLCSTPTSLASRACSRPALWPGSWPSRHSPTSTIPLRARAPQCSVSRRVLPLPPRHGRRVSLCRTRPHRTSSLSSPVARALEERGAPRAPTPASARSLHFGQSSPEPEHRPPCTREHHHLQRTAVPPPPGDLLHPPIAALPATSSSSPPRAVPADSDQGAPPLS